MEHTERRRGGGLYLIGMWCGRKVVSGSVDGGAIFAALGGRDNSENITNSFFLNF